MTSTRRSSRKSTASQTQTSHAALEDCEDAFQGLEEVRLYENEGKSCELRTYERRFDSRGEAILLESSLWSEIDLQEVLKEGNLRSGYPLDPKF